MNFKPPRDPNTPSPMLILRQVIESENILCEVGSGECQNLASEAHDDGEGGTFYVCAQHAIEVHALGKLVSEMTTNQIESFTQAIAAAQPPCSDPPSHSPPPSRRPAPPQ